MKFLNNFNLGMLAAFFFSLGGSFLNQHVPLAVLLILLGVGVCVLPRRKEDAS